MHQIHTITHLFVVECLSIAQIMRYLHYQMVLQYAIGVVVDGDRLPDVV
jgi:hypothetical protein